MGIQAELKQISIQTLELLKRDGYLVNFFRKSKWLPESSFWQESQWIGDYAEKTKQEARERFGRLSLSQKIKRSVMRVFKPNEVIDYDWNAIEKQFLEEWEVPELDLDKSFPELMLLISGYLPGYSQSEWTFPELKVYPIKPNRDFLSFMVINKSQLDGLPLVNAIGAGAELDYQTGYGPVRYLLPNEVEQMVDGLLKLTEEGFQKRYQQESQKTKPYPSIDWSDDETLEYLTDYYNEIVSYYQDAATNHRAMLLYLT